MTEVAASTEQEQRDHGAFLERKVDAARISVREGRGRTNEAVEAEFAARRAGVPDPA